VYNGGEEDEKDPCIASLVGCEGAMKDEQVDDRIAGSEWALVGLAREIRKGGEL